MKVYYLFNIVKGRFEEVGEDTLKHVPDWSNGNYVIAFNPDEHAKIGLNDKTYWQFDVNFSGAFGEEISALVAVVKKIQGNLLTNDQKL